MSRWPHWWLLLLVSGGTYAAGSPRELCGGVQTGAWISSSWRSRGYHVLCWTPGACTEGLEDGLCSAGVTAQVCWSGFLDDCEDLTNVSGVLAQEGKAGLVALQDLLTARRPALNQWRHNALIKGRAKHNKPLLNFAFFAVEDDRRTPRQLDSLQGVSGMVLAFEGGVFLWPGVQVNFRRNITIQPKNSEPLHLELETRSLQPLVLEISSFLGDADCQHIIDKALPHVQRSSVKHMDHDVGKPDANWRTSSTYFMQSDDDVLRRLDDRVSSLTLIRKTHQEYAQILRYEQGEQYVAHHDYFDPSFYKNNQDIQNMIRKGLFNRLATVFFYLSDVEEGGETNFPRAGGRPQPHDFADCSKGVSVFPKRGRIIIFYSMHPSGEMDESSLHGGCTVKRGTKWSANKWIWNKQMDYTRE